MRKRIYEVIEIAQDNDKLSHFYDSFMLVAIIVSLIPLAFKSENMVFIVLDKVVCGIFIIDYLLRWMTADYKLEKGKWSFVKYPFTIMAIFDLLSILPSLSIISKGFKVLRVLRMLRALRVIRVFKAFRYSRNIAIIVNVFKKQKDSLMVVCWLAVAYILVSALVVFNIEPDTFESFFDAIYWATVSLTTVGYGDIYATSMAGKVITMVSALFGIAIVALPAGIVTAGYMDEINSKQEK